MGSGQPIGTESELEKQAGTLDASTELPPSENTDVGASTSSSAPTPATTLNGTPATLKNAALEALKSKAGLVAGALADFQAVKGLVTVAQIPYDVEGATYQAVKVILLVPNASLVAVSTPDGLDFDIVAGQ